MCFGLSHDFASIRFYMMSSGDPLVSVVMATYNRSNVLPYSIGSLIRGSFQDWELIVVGDCCTDDTEQVVASFHDPRIRFVNLKKNVGEQSGPNNHGVGIARGEYIAYLNHDDMWCDNHLQDSVSLMSSAEADLIFSQALLVPFNAAVTLTGATTDKLQDYHPWMSVPATLWLFKKTMTDRFGAWRPSQDIRVVPSQDWLYRAYRGQAKILANPNLSAIIVNSASRLHAYRERQVEEHRYWFSVLIDPIALRNALSSAFAGQIQREILSNPWQIMVIAVRQFFRYALLKFRVWPPYIRYWLRYWRRGAYLKYLRKRRGLPD